MKIGNKFLVIAIQVAVVGLSLQSFAGRDDFNKPSKELAEAIGSAATTMGYDLSSKEGRKQFGDYMKTQRDTLATSLGIDMSTEEGRKKYHESVKTHVDEVAKSQNFDLTTKEGRDSLEKYFITNGEYAYVRPEPKEKRGPREEGGKDQEKKQHGMKDREMKDSGEQVERRPPPPRDQEKRPAIAKDAGQEKRPEQKQ